MCLHICVFVSLCNIIRYRLFAVFINKEFLFYVIFKFTFLDNNNYILASFLKRDGLFAINFERINLSIKSISTLLINKSYI